MVTLAAAFLTWRRNQGAASIAAEQVVLVAA
jgi:hypothetical protein